MPKRRESLGDIGHLVILSMALIMVLIAGISSVNLPAFGDGQAYMIPNALKMAENGTQLFLEDEVHPPLYFILEGVGFRLAGADIRTAHMLIMIFVLLAIISFYQLGKGLQGIHFAGIAVLFMCAWPPFLIQVRLIRLSIPLTAFCILTILGAQKGWALLYVVAGTASALTKAPGVIFPATMAGLSTIRLIRTRLPLWILWTPVVAFLLWLGACRLHYGWFLHPENTADFSYGFNDLAECTFFWIRRLVIDQRTWLLIGFSCAVLLWKNRILAIPLLLLILLGILLPQLHWLDGLAVGLLFILFYHSWNRGGLWRVFPISIILFILLFSPYHYRFPRYMIPIWPGIALICASVITATRFRLTIPIAVLCAAGMASTALETSIWTSKPINWTLHETNLGYMDYISCRDNAADLLQNSATETLIIAGRKAADDLLIPALGYVTHPLRVTKIEELLTRKIPSAMKDTVFYYEHSMYPPGWKRKIRQLAARSRMRLIELQRCTWSGGHSAVFKIVPEKRTQPDGRMNRELNRKTSHRLTAPNNNPGKSPS